MKKSLIAGAASLALAAMPVVSTFAVPPQAASEGGYFTGFKDVTVGEVDETVYSVDIDWGDMTFDWKYDAEANEFNFQPHKRCMAIANNDSTTSVLMTLQEQGKLYNDLTSCETPAASPLDAEMYAYLAPDGGIGVYDSSTNGKIKAKLSFSASEEYSWVNGKFGTWSVLSGDTFIEYANEYLPMAYNGSSYGNLVLEKNSNYDASAESVATNDKIGTVTITIEPDLN